MYLNDKVKFSGAYKDKQRTQNYSSMGNWGGQAKAKNEKLKISSFKKYRVLKKSHL